MTSPHHAEPLEFDAGQGAGTVSARLLRPSGAGFLYVMAHGAGAGMRHPFMETLAMALAECGVTTFRYQFPYMEAGGRRPDPPSALEATVRSALAAAAPAAPGAAPHPGGETPGGGGAAAAAMMEGAGWKRRFVRRWRLRPRRHRASHSLRGANRWGVG